MKQLALIALLILVACSTEQLSNEQAIFKEKCLADGNQWMKMSEMKEGTMTGPPCYGCMPDEKSHICSQAEYEAHVK